MAQEKANKSLIRPVVKAATISGLIQGLVWTIMSVLAICCYFNVIAAPDPTQTLDYGEIIFYFFLYPDAQTVFTTLNIVIGPKEFIIFVFIYLVVSLAWLIISSYVLWTMIRNKWNHTVHVFIGWSVVTILISLLDFILMSLIAYDYHQIKNLSLGSVIQSTFVAYGIVMSLAARGYILWIINVIFAVILLRFVRNIITDNKNDSTPTRPIINGYESSSSIYPPWFKETSSEDVWVSNPNTFTSPKTNNENAFMSGNENHGFERSHSFFPTTFPSNKTGNSYDEDGDTKTNFNWNFNPISSSLYNDNSKITKKKRPSDPTSPIIPDPDYTPPSTPSNNFLKSVLRSKSNY